MIRGYSAEQIRAAEAPHLAAGEPLMAIAATGLAEVIRNELGSMGVPDADARVLLLVGSGNNGGDALYAGAELAASGCQVRIAVLGSRVHGAGLAAALHAGARTIDLAGAGEQARPPIAAGGGGGADGGGGRDAEAVAAVLDAASDAEVIVDGILGTGARSSPALRGTAREVVAALGRFRASPRRRVVAVDLPSGIDADTGEVPDDAVLVADVTVTFGAYKAGLLRGAGATYAGRVVFVDIGLGPDLEGIEPLVVV
ncbi:hypothetical protein GCM10028798_04530 [Humibacter antri]